MKRLIRRVTSVHVLIFGVFFCVLTYYASSSITDPDIPWHIATGTYILNHHAIPTTDIFSWSSTGKPWVTQEWGFEVILAFLVKNLGFLGTVLLNVIVGAMTMLVMYRVSLNYTKTNKVAAMIMGCMSVFVATPFWIDRPQIASYLLFALFIWILEQTRQGKFIPLVFAPLLIWVWANLHASAIIGVLMQLFEVVLSFVPSIGNIEQLQLPKGARWRLLLSGLVGAVAGIITPLGVKSYEYALLSGNALLSKDIAEWNAPNFQEAYYAYFFVPILFAISIIVIARRQKQPIKPLIYTLGTLYLLLMHQRFMPYFAIALAFLLSANVSGLFKGLMTISKRIRIINSVLLVLMMAWIGGLIPRVQGPVSQHFSASAFPIKAVNYMENHHLTDNVLNTYGFGGYLIYRGIPTFVDGRTDIFLKDGVFKDYIQIQDVKNTAPTLLQKYPFHTALVQRGSTFDTLLAMNPKWKLAYKSDVADVFVKKDPN